jgi:hypothetical protein
MTGKGVDYCLLTPSVSLFSPRAWANPSPRLHQAGLLPASSPALRDEGRVETFDAE